MLLEMASGERLDATRVLGETVKNLFEYGRTRQTCFELDEWNFLHHQLQNKLETDCGYETRHRVF